MDLSFNNDINANENEYTNVVVDNSFYASNPLNNNFQNFRNSLYCLNIAVEEKYKNLLLNNENNRLYYCKNNIALRTRSIGNPDIGYEGQENNDLNLPFMNYKAVKILPSTRRPWFNFMGNVEGIYIPELNRKLRVSPITINYESTMWLSTDIDTQYAYQQLMYDSDVETKIEYYINIAGHDIKMIAIVDYNLDFEPEYDEADWLQRNNIHSIGIDFSIQTMYILDNSNICIPESVIMSFKALNDLGDVEDETILSMISNRYSEIVTLP